MAWSTPPTFVAGPPPLTAAQLNVLSGNLNVIGGAWTSYTPTLTNITIGNGTLSAKYKQIDKTVYVRVRFAAGTTTTYAAGTLGISAPVTPHADYTTGASQDWAIGSAIIQPTTRQGGTVVFATTTSGVFNFFVDNLGSANIVTNAIPGTFGTGSVITLTAEYEAA